MNQHGGLDLGALGNDHSLEEDLMQGLRDTGMYEMAAEMGLVQDGMMPDVRLHEHWQAEDGEQQPGPSGAYALQAQQLVGEADSAATAACSAAEEVAARLEAALNRPHSAATSGQSTPTRQRRRRGSAAGQAEEQGAAGGRGGSRGLRHFSMKVCEKVESKQRTTYNEVADELVAELPRATAAMGNARQYDEKNIRRRVYDALNVLMAMDIITRQKKDIVWRGLPHNQVTQLERLRADHARLVTHINKQKSYIEELQKQQAAYRGLLQRNRDRPLHALQAGVDMSTPTALPLPFVLIQVDPGAIVEIQISPDSRVAQFDFRSTPFRMVGDEDVLYGLKLHELAPPGAANGSAEAPSAAPPPGRASSVDAATAQQLLEMSAGQGNSEPLPEPMQQQPQQQQQVAPQLQSHPPSHNGLAHRQPQPFRSKWSPGSQSSEPQPAANGLVDPHSLPPFQDPAGDRRNAASLWQSPVSNGGPGSSYLYG